jgi:hypothetical protein
MGEIGFLILILFVFFDLSVIVFVFILVEVDFILTSNFLFSLGIIY